MYQRILNQNGGVSRTSTLIEAGLSRHRLSHEVGTGRLRRIRRGWVARPDADPALVFAAAHGLTLSCVTQAARLKIWVRDPSQRHFAVPRPGAEVRPAGARLHYRRPTVPRHRFALTDSLADTLITIAHCQPYEDAVASWNSALNKGLIDREALAALPLQGPASAVLAATTPFADSGLESYVMLRLRWLRVPIRAQIWLFGHRVDVLIGSRLVLQIDGGHHVGAQRTEDIAHDAELELRGYRVIRVGYDQIMNNWPDVQDLVMQAIARGHHLAH